MCEIVCAYICNYMSASMRTSVFRTRQFTTQIETNDEPLCCLVNILTRTLASCRTLWQTDGIKMSQTDKYLQFSIASAFSQAFVKDILYTTLVAYFVKTTVSTMSSYANLLGNLKNFARLVERGYGVWGCEPICTFCICRCYAITLSQYDEILCRRIMLFVSECLYCDC